MKNKKIFLSIVTPTLNNEKDIVNFLNSVKRQNKREFNLEIVMADGGSKDKTISLAKKMGARVIANPYVFADPGVNLGIKKAKGDLLMVLAVDNIFEDKNSFNKIVDVFKDRRISAAFPVQSSKKNDSIYTKYINRFTDPFNHFVYGFASNGRSFKRAYKTLETNKIYDIYDYRSNPDKPLIAVAQGFIVRRGFTKSRNSAFDDILPVIELINKKNRIAFIHSVKLYHHTVRNLRHFAVKQAWATINALQKKKYGIAHRRAYLSKNQKLRIKIWPIYALSFLAPLLRSICGLIIEKEPLWLFHPFLCMISACSSLIAGIGYIVNSNLKLERK